MPTWPLSVQRGMAVLEVKTLQPWGAREMREGRGYSFPCPFVLSLSAGQGPLTSVLYASSSR